MGLVGGFVVMFVLLLYCMIKFVMEVFFDVLCMEFVLWEIDVVLL